MMSNNKSAQTISNEEQVAVVNQNASPLQSVSKPDKQSKIRRKRVLAISAVIVPVIAGGYFGWNASHYEDTDDAQVTGRVMPLSTRANGQIKAVYINEGQFVHAGEAMMTIDPENYKIAAVLAQVNASEAEAAAARFHSNIPIDSVAVQSYGDSANQANAEAAEAEASRRELQLAQAELNLSYTVICSPVAGIVGKTRAEVGQNVNIGQDLVDVLPLDDIWVTANFKETQLAHMRPSQPVEVNVDAYGRKWKGHVTNLGGGTGSVFSSLRTENVAGNYVKVVQRMPVRIDFDRAPGQEFNGEGMLKPGLSVEPKVKVR